MKWENIFRDWILERGRQYYNSNRVANMIYENNLFQARVLGEKPYDVRIEISDDKIVLMRCSCPFAASGQKCKHMAAVLYAIEEKGDKLRQAQMNIEEKIYPFQKKSQEYSYFDLSKMADEFEITKRIYDTAQKMVQDNQIILQSVQVGYPDYINANQLRGIAKGYYTGDPYPGEITIVFDKNHILKSLCMIPKCHIYYERGYYYSKKNLCEHAVALLILLEEYLQKYNPGDSTDQNGYMLFQGFRSIQAKTILEQDREQKKDVLLEPVLEKTGEKLNLTLKIGTDKLYVVKNITNLVKDYEEHATVTLGTKSELSFSKHRIHEKAQSILQFVESIVKEQLQRIEHTRFSSKYYVEEEPIRNRIELYGERLDRFYDLFENQTILCNDKSDIKSVKKMLKICGGKPDIQLKIQKDVDEDGIFHGVEVTGRMPEIVEGAKYSYYCSNTEFCRIGGKIMRMIQPLLNMSRYGDISFYVGRKYLSEFYHQVLPVLREIVDVEETETEFIEQYIPPNAVFQFYLDAEEGNITCKAKVRYGEEEVSLIDNLKENHVFESFRNVNREQEILYQVHQLFPEIDYEKEEFQCGQSEEVVFHVLESGVDTLLALGEVHTTDRFRNLNIRRKMKVKVGVSVESDIMNLTVSSDEIEQEELLKILQSYKRKKKYYRLKNGDFVVINENDIEVLSQMMETLHVTPREFTKGKMKIPMYRALYLNKMLEQGENIYLNRDKHFKNLIKEFKTVEDSDFEVPEKLGTVMRNYQVRGFKWMRTLEHYGFGGILADDMGLGKTLQIISVLLAAKEANSLGTALIVAPASLVYNWKEEFHRFAPNLNVTLVVGNQQERAELIQNYQKSDVLVTSYDLLKRDVAEYEEASFQYQVLDEAQYIKNHTTAAAKSVKIIKSKQRYALTGTPIENRLSELWSIFDYLMPGFLYGYDVFRKEFETPIVKNKEKEVSDRLKKMVSPFILRRLKADVLKDLPDKMEEVRYAKLEQKQQQLYDAQVIHMKNMIQNQEASDFQKNKMQILAELTKIRQICCDPELLFDKYTDGSAKREACLDLVKSAMEGEHKILIFSQFTSMLELLEADMKKEKIAYYKITGATPKDKRLEMVNDFNKDATPVFLISLKAGGTGLNLIGADVVIHYDPWWNQAVQNQATDRAHRIGQTRIVSVYKLIAKGTIEEKIVKMQESKKDLADTILNGETGGITQMSKEELLDLLEGK